MRNQLKNNKKFESLIKELQIKALLLKLFSYTNLVN